MTDGSVLREDLSIAFQDGAAAVETDENLDFVFVSPINEHCPIGGGGTRGGVFARGKTASFGMTSAPTSAEKSAATSYKGTWYHDMNGALRGTGSGSGSGTGSGTHSAMVQEKVAGMTSIVNRGVTKTAGVVYRGVNHPELSKLDWAGKVGTKITFKGFTSTSHSANFAKVEKGWGSGSNQTFFRIYVPKGAKALEYKQVHGGHDNEHEVILPHNSTFTVHATSKTPGGGRTVDLILHR